MRTERLLRLRLSHGETERTRPRGPCAGEPVPEPGRTDSRHRRLPRPRLPGRSGPLDAALHQPADRGVDGLSARGVAERGRALAPGAPSGRRGAAGRPSTATPPRAGGAPRPLTD